MCLKMQKRKRISSTIKYGGTIIALVMLITMMGIGFGPKTEIAYAYSSGSLGNGISWDLNDNGLLTISGTGAIPNYSQGSSPFTSMSSKIKAVNIYYSITSIGDYAFANCSQMTSVSCGGGIKTIGTGAFSNCWSLNSINLPMELNVIKSEAFIYCYGLENVFLPSKLTAVGSDVFMGCDNLGYINFACEKLTVNKYSFRDFGAKTGVKYAGFVAPIDEVAKQLQATGYTTLETTKEYSLGTTSYNIKGILHSNGVLILSGTESMMNYDNNSAIKSPFYNSSNITAVVVDGKIDNIGNGMFQGCSKLTSVTISDKATNIGSNAFRGCSALESVTIANKTRTASDTTAVIGDHAFRDCKNLKSIDISSKIKSIGKYCFSGCSSLQTATFPTYNNGCLIDLGEGAFSDCTSLKKVNLPNTVENVYDNAFSGCIELQEIYFSNAIKSLSPGVLSGCTSLEKAMYLGNAASISKNAFLGCSSLKSISLPLKAMDIGESAFDGCSSLESIIIPKNIESIQANAFRGCSSLKKATLTDAIKKIGVGAFAGCSSLESINIPMKLSAIEANTFDGCSMLKEIFIPQNVSSIGSAAFRNCKKLARIESIYKYEQKIAADSFLDVGTGLTESKVAYFHSKNTKLKSALEKQYTCFSTTASEMLGSNVEAYFYEDGELFIFGTGEIDYDATITNKDTVKSIRFSEGAVNIPEGFFSGCKEITKLTIPSSVKMIDDEAFKNCTSLTSITLPEGIRYLGIDLFANCTSLESVTIPSSVENINSQAFLGCTSLANITIPSKVTGIGMSAFENCTSLANVAILTKETSISDKAFKGCTKLVGITFPSGGTSTSGNYFTIGKEAFMNCESLTSIDIPLGIDSIAQNTFVNCASLTSVTIPSSIGYIEAGTFQNCPSLESFTFDPYTTDVRDNVFVNCPKLETIKVVVLDDTKMPESQRSKSFAGCGTAIKLVLVDQEGVELPESRFRVAYKKFKSASDGDTEDNCWYGTEIYPPYTLTYVVNGTKIVKKYLIEKQEIKLAINDTIAKNIPYRSRFCGWYQAPQFTGEFLTHNDSLTMPANDVVLYARLKNIETPKGLKVTATNADTIIPRNIKFSVEGYEPGKTFYKVLPSGNTILPDVGTVIDTSDKGNWKKVTSKEMTVYVDYDSEYCVQVVTLDDKYDGYPFDQLSVVKGGLCDDVSYRAKLSIGDFKYNLTSVPYTGKGQPINVTSGKVSSKYIHVAYNDIMYSTPEKPGVYEVTIDVDQTYSFCKVEKLYLGKYEILRPAPTELIGYGISAVGETDGKISGLTTEMEYKDKSASEYTKFTGEKGILTGLKPGTYYVRFAADPVKGLSAGVDAEINVKASSKKSAPKGLVGKGISVYGATDGTITGTTEEMEYKLKATDQYEKCTSKAMSQLAAGTYLVRYAATEELDASEPVEVTVDNSKKQLAPKELKGTGVSTLGATDGTITGTTAAMEYKLKTATNYEKCTSKAMSQLAAGTYHVRYAATEELLASEAVEVTVENSKKQQAPKELKGTGVSTLGVTDGTITGTTEAMEYKLKAATKYEKCTSKAMSQLAAGTYLVRYAATEELDASEPVEVTVANSKKQQAPKELKGTGVSTLGATDGTITGTTEAMEYKLKAAAQYEKCTSKAMSQLAAGTYLVRYASTEELVSSEPVEVTVESSKKQQAPKGLKGTGVSTLGATDGTITGTTEAMEYKLKVAAQYEKCTSKAMSQLAAGTYLVRYAATEELVSSEPVEVTVESSKKQQAPKGLKGTGVSTLGATDGTITGTTEAMEYKLKAATKYEKCTSKAMSQLAAGTYLVRYAATEELAASEPVEVTVANSKKQMAPKELKGTGVSTINATDGTITGTTEAMEYKLKAATNYEKCTSKAMSQLAAGTYLVRYAATGELAASEPVEVTVNSSKKQQAPKGLKGTGVSTLDATDGTITGTTEAMEYKLKAADQYEKCTSKAMSQLAAGTYLIRYAATEELVASEVVEITVNSSKKQQAPKGLKGTGVSTLGATDGTITGTTESMEYKLKAADQYEKCTSKAMSQLAAGTYLVRYAATEELAASEPVEVTVDSSKKQPAPKELKGTGVSTLGATDGTIAGTTEAMEYKLKAATNYEKCTSKAMSQLAAGTYLIRYAATEELVASEVVEITVNSSKKQQAPKGLKGTGVSTLGATDGTITGTTEAMEYKLKAATQYEKCTSKAMSQLAAGTYLVRYAAKEELVVSEAVEVTVENAIPMTYTVSGTIKDISGNPAPGVTVSLVNIADNNKVYKVATSEQGVYTIANVLDGSYKIIVTKDDKELNTGNVTVSGNNVSGGSCDITVTIAPPTYTIIGTVKMVKVSAATGSAISVSGAAITLSSTTSLMTYAEVTDNNGNYTINGVPDGTYAIAVTINDKVIAAGNIKVNGSNVCDDSTSILVTDPTPDPKPDPKPDPTPDPKPNPTPNPAPGPTGPINVPMNPTPAAPPVLAPKAEPKIVKTEEIKSGVKLGEADSSDVIIPIQRTTDSDGKKKDTAAYKEDTAKETIQKLKEEGKDVARITIPDEKNEISETNVMIPTASLEVIAEGNINLEIATEKARISIPKETLKNADKEAKEDVYFNLAPITSAGEQAQIIERAKQEDIIKVAIKDSIMTVVGTPMTIETNMPQSNVDITLPLATSDIPTDAIEREKFLSKLAVFIEHSDGDMELVRGEIVEYKEGVLGIKFNVKKFSTFTILQADSLAQESSACEIEKVKEPKETIMKGTKLSLTVNNTKTKIKVKVTVSADATWKLYSDVACKKEIKNKYLKLKVGKNKAYIKVFAKDGTSKGYTITVKRKGKE